MSPHTWRWVATELARLTLTVGFVWLVAKITGFWP